MKTQIFCLGAAAFALFWSPAAQASGGPYIVDNAGITEPGGVKFEAWASRANTGDEVFVLAPGFTPTSIPFAEFEVVVERRRTAGSWQTGLSPAVKLAARDTEAHGFGLALVAGVTLPGDMKRTEAAFVAVPLTVAVTDAWHLHVNAGVERDFEARETTGSWGVSAQGFLADRLEMVAEVFGAQNGPTYWQAGLRPYLPGGTVAVEIAYARHLGGERGDWLTIGLSAGF